MGLFRELIKTSVKVVAAPIYVPLKIAESLRKPSTYNYWYHDGGQGSDTDSSASSEKPDDNSAGE